MPDAQQQLPTTDAPPSRGGPNAAPPIDLTGRTLGDYQILRRLGVGGMGQVYLARQLSLKREVALKLLRTELITNATALKRFQGEAEAVARLNHPNIVHIHQLGETDGLRYMVLEYVEGRNLRDHLMRKGPPDLPVTLSVIRQVALALQKAHEEGIVHRDIKPENILVTRKVEVKVTDFGLSRFFAGQSPATNLTQSGVTLGTPLYMSPEQVQGHTVDLRSDIYSLGVTCYHLLAGEPPFRGVSAFDVALKHVQEQPRPLVELRPDLPADLCGMVHKMMAKNPADRYQSARDILRDLVKVRDGINVGLAQQGLPTNTMSLALSTSGMNGALVPAPLALTASGPQVPAQPVRWGRWVFALLACVAATVGGVFLYAKLNPSAEPAPFPTPPPAPIGLADVRPTDKLTTTRERELLAMLASRDTKDEDIFAASIELGLMYVKERRLDEADARFRKLENESFRKDVALTRVVSMAGRLGQAIVLAHRENPASAQQSLNLVVSVLEAPFPKSPKLDKNDRTVVLFLARHPDLAFALAEALNRNAASLKKEKGEKLEPPVLEQLRTPPRSGKP